MSAYEGDLGEVLAAADADGVTGILTASTSLGDVPRNLSVAAHGGTPAIWAAVGIHPHEARTWDDTTEAKLTEASGQARVVAIGETGLDYHYDFSPRETQREVFARQVRLAAEAGLPIIVHCRKAAGDVASILESEGGKQSGGVIHCFTEDAAFARRCLAMNFYISFSGILTFRNAGHLREVARLVPESRLLVETDSPYLTPVPHRGARNEPRRVRLVLEALARERDVDPAALSDAVTRNFHTLFTRTRS